MGLSHLSNFINLKEIDLSGCLFLINHEGFHVLSKLTNLQKINLRAEGEYFSSYFLDDTLGILSNLNLQDIDLSGCDEITDKGLTHFSNFTNLRKIDLSECNNITDKGLTHLSNLRNLRKIDLSDCDKITDEGRAYVGQLTKK